MSQWLRACIALPEDLGLVPNTRQLTAIYSSVLGDLSPLLNSRAPGIRVVTQIYIPAEYMHINKSLNNTHTKQNKV